MDAEAGKVPVVTSSNSGGTMFVTRYFALRDLPTARKWTFPCYLLLPGMAKVCFFHGPLGEMSEECEVEKFNTVSAAVGVTVGPLFAFYGGPFGQASSWSSVYFVFLSGLPIPTNEKDFVRFWLAHKKYNTYMQRESNWIVSFTLIDSVIAGQPALTYGWDSYVSRGISALTPDGSASTNVKNFTVYSIAAISANTLSAFSTIPFAFAAKTWGNLWSPLQVGMKLFTMTLSYLMMQKLMAQKTVIANEKFCEGQASGACPALDGAFSDNGPLTPTLAYGSQLSIYLKPREIMLSGPASTFALIKFLTGSGPMDLWTQAGINMCPFQQTEICSMITKTRQLAVQASDQVFKTAYKEIADAFIIWRPEAQVIHPYCGDPLIFDNFQGQCVTSGFCHDFFTVIPNDLQSIVMTVEPWVMQLSMALLSNTPISTRFVIAKIPDAMKELAYYQGMETWFPDFRAVALKRGGVGFTKPAAHALLDYLTYLVTRLSEEIVVSRLLATEVYKGEAPHCGYLVYEKVKQFNFDHTNSKFVMS
jgi:hypothetical protein